MTELFKVWIQPVGEETHFCDSEDEWVTAAEIEKALIRLLKGPSRFFWQRVWVVDMLDCTNFEWTREDGVVFPPAD